MTFNELAAWIELCAPKLAFDLRDVPIMFEPEPFEDHALAVAGAAVGNGEIRLYRSGVK